RLYGVDHWLTTLPGLTLFRHFPGQLVAHSTEWTTSSQLFRAFDPFSTLPQVASGPLKRVDHWLTPHYILRNFGLDLSVKVALSRPDIGTV
ncbi:hypothetical protein, partial [Abiotrophia sp. HMSC24B09]|uniref:hypothetical protein n=1 Tax=Abiotrophia sp. HMSC24B09 TaxID=1581061 RepID=UPI001C5A2165